MLETIISTCTCDKKEHAFVFVGTQYFKKEKMFDLYNCTGCQTTKAFNYTEYYNEYYNLNWRRNNEKD